jgi:hypothetical protein
MLHACGSRIADHSINRIEELLPWKLAAELAGITPQRDALAKLGVYP